MQPPEHYAALVQSSNDGIVAKDLDGIVTSWNPAAERLFGWTEAEMVGQSIRRLLPPELAHQEDEILANVRGGVPAGIFVAERLHKDGHRIPVAVTVSPVRDAAGNIVGACKIARDAAAHVEALHRLEESEERFRMLADNMAQFAWIARPDGHIFWYNKRWHDYTGYSLDDMAGWGWTKVHHPDHVDRVVERIQHSWDTGEEWEDTFPLRSHDGEWRWFLSRAKPIRCPDGTIRFWFGTNTDITEQREQADQIALLLNEVNHRSKNMLAKVQALARRTEGASKEFVRRFEERVNSLMVNQDILVRRAWRDLPVRELVSMQMSFLGGASRQIAVEGPDCALNPRAAEALGMALHELATNSLKYGALSTEAGRVALNWAIEADGGFTMSWQESGGPPVFPPAKSGFGTVLIKDMPSRACDAQVTLEYAPTGIAWRFASDARVFA
ncbi:MAG: PAS domain S-box protein [Sphingomonadales bacterium]|nr:PAS domain S-box protein [Sphingomonadales bacterium]MBD3774758.1 PAS domain S-box protein [Paracoccaceae bacterium]